MGSEMCIRDSDLGESNKAIEMVVTGKMPVAVPLQFGYVDV